jgi:hypothetical protein
MATLVINANASEKSVKMNLLNNLLFSICHINKKLKD